MQPPATTKPYEHEDFPRSGGFCRSSVPAASGRSPPDGSAGHGRRAGQTHRAGDGPPTGSVPVVFVGAPAVQLAHAFARSG